METLRAILREIALSFLEAGVYTKGETRKLANLTLEGISDEEALTHLSLTRPLSDNLFVGKHYPLLIERTVEGLRLLGMRQVPEYYTFEALKHLAKLGKALRSGALTYIRLSTNGQEALYDRALYEYLSERVNRTQKRSVLIAGHVEMIDLGRRPYRLRLYTPFLPRGLYAVFSPELKAEVVQSLDRLAIISGEAVTDGLTDEIYSIAIQNLHLLEGAPKLEASFVESLPPFSLDDLQEMWGRFTEDLPPDFAEWVRSERNRHIPPSENE
ncbi:MAG: hypothetical protein ABDH91_05855 [Bacteroidia bacterium]